MNESWNQDPERALFTLVRYKFVARMVDPIAHRGPGGNGLPLDVAVPFHLEHNACPISSADNLWRTARPFAHDPMTTKARLQRKECERLSKNVVI